MPDAAAELYLDLLKKTLTRFDMGDERVGWTPDKAVDRQALKLFTAVTKGRNIEVVRVKPFDPASRAVGLDWPQDAETMVGIRRLDNLQDCIVTVVSEGVPGDILEAGVWRGGASIFGRGVLKALGVEDRSVWVADSFEGLPPPDPAFPSDAGDQHHTVDFLAVSLEEVRANFAKFGLLDDRVRFLKGWFSDTLPSAPIDAIAVLRADGDMYGSTMDILTSLYNKVSPGGFIIIDDYGALEQCRQAVTDFRERHNVVDPITMIDWTGAFWRRS